jgi:site-specific recombinase XerD
MTQLAPALQAFFTTRLTSQFGASPRTIAAYRDSWRLLLTFIADTKHIPPQRLDFAQLKADTISEFLLHLEVVRGNSVSTRNARLAAIHSFFGYAAVRHPEHADTISQIMAIPAKRHHRTDVTYLTTPEVQALLDAPDQATKAGRRDHALLQLAVTAGLRVSELTALAPADLHFGAGAHVVCHGKGRRRRITPLDRQTAEILRRRDDDHQEDHAARVAAFLRDAASRRRDRHHRHRALARSPEHRNDAGLSPRRHEDEGDSTRPNHPDRVEDRPLQTEDRQAARVPARALIMPTSRPPSALHTRLAD